MARERITKTQAEKMLLDQIKPNHPEVQAVMMRRDLTRQWEFGFLRDGRSSGRAGPAAMQLAMDLEEQFEVADG